MEEAKIEKRREVKFTFETMPIHNHSLFFFFFKLKFFSRFENGGSEQNKRLLPIYGEVIIQLCNPVTNPERSFEVGPIYI